MDTGEKLKACPFCGSLDIHHGATEKSSRRCLCRACHAEGPPVWPDKLKGSTAQETNTLRTNAAYEKWQARTSDPLVEKLKEALQKIKHILKPELREPGRKAFWVAVDALQEAEGE